MLLMSILSLPAHITIKTVTPETIKEVKELVAHIVRNVLNLSESIETIKQQFLPDEDNIQELYFGNQGTYLALFDNNKIVGTGALKRIDPDTAELKRMFFKPAYRGKGFGLCMMQELFTFALQQGYKRIRLEVFKPELQKQAVTFYTKRGFNPIAPYNNKNSGLYMEKVINPID